ncbi:hypothetical protein BBF96_07575 [Anoxybacter fermentans]|uniref:HTH lacI-type domain-containing protein n=1 Tax=Anoxybacter fermentans TaxID=1323375 RepID=A0A3Q9HQ89_9FIRM|nr:LacI family DNA-binding transcriptional regulator [Anoxybacter fermentans]AZR73257.1 hypothetical protein BBF96_07575 [Anoxybacter fermentans]
MGVTIYDIAKRANVSPSTVSRVFNQKGRIAPETRDKVLAIARELGYQPREYKSKNKNSKTKSIGIIFSNRLLNNLTGDPFYGQVMEGVEQSLREHNYQLFFKTITGKLEQDLEIIDDLINVEEHVGLILTGYEIDRKIIMKIKESNFPLVLVDNDLWDENIDCIVNDNIAGARKIVSHLIQLGHKRIAFIGGPLTHISLDERYMGYKQALKEADIEKDPNLIVFCEPTFNPEDGYRAAMAILNQKENRPTAFFAANDMLAIGVMKAIKEMGYSIPEDISIAGFDDIQMAQHTMPALTTVRIFKHEMGFLAGKRLIELINGVFTKPIKVVVSVEPVIRESTGPIVSS